MMEFLRRALNHLVAATGAILLLGSVASAQSADTDGGDRLSELRNRLADPGTTNWQLVEQEIVQRWSISGSATADLLLGRGMSAMRAGNIERAISHFTALIDHAPEFAEGWNARATAYFQAGQYGPSIADVQQVLVLNPNHFGALTGLGMMLEEMRELDDALVAYRAARAIHPHRPDIEGAVVRIEQALEGTAL